MSINCHHHHHLLMITLAVSCQVCVVDICQVPTATTTSTTVTEKHSKRKSTVVCCYMKEIGKVFDKWTLHCYHCLYLCFLSLSLSPTSASRGVREARGKASQGQIPRKHSSCEFISRWHSHVLLSSMLLLTCPQHLSSTLTHQTMSEWEVVW